MYHSAKPVRTFFLDEDEETQMVLAGIDDGMAQGNGEEGRRPISFEEVN